MYEMKPEYYTGIDFIDEEHSKLFEIANKAYDLVKNDFIADKYDYIMEVLEELRDYTRYHFNHEEQYMESIGYKRLFSQKVSHSEFIERLNNYMEKEIDRNQKDMLVDILNFLTDWLVEHIYHSDKLIGKP